MRVELSAQLVEKVDGILGLYGFSSREEFVEVAVRRLLDRYTVLAEGTYEKPLSEEGRSAPV